MAHFALLDSTLTVIAVHVASDVMDGRELDLCQKSGKTYRQTSYNTYAGVHKSGDPEKAFRKNYAGIGYKYDEERDAFIPPKPFPSWILNEESCLWEAPVEYPTDGVKLLWNEETTSWEASE